MAASNGRPETADMDRASLHVTAPVPDPTGQRFWRDDHGRRLANHRLDRDHVVVGVMLGATEELQV
jgi:hypothetical protein